LERKERELEKEKQERRELRRVVRRQENTIGALQQRLRSAGLAIDDDDDEALAPTVDDDVDKKFDDEQRPMDKEEKRRDEEKLLHVEEAKVDEKKKERRTKESEEETMTLLLEAMDQEATLPADGYHEEGGAKEQQLPQSEAKKNEDEDKNEVKNEDEKNENEENEDEEALLCDMSPTLRFDGEHDDYAGEEAPSGIVSDPKPSGPDADRSLTPPGELALVGKRKREDDNTAAPAKVSLSALLRKHLSPLPALPHPPTRTTDDPTDRSPSEPRARPPMPLPLALGSDAGDDSEKLPRPPSGRVEKVPRTPSPARDLADGNGGEPTRQAVSPMFKALFLAKKKTAD
jgi:hypothetical protein